jgi:Na+/phosphate symporter
MAGKKTTVPDPVVVLNDTYQVTLDSRCLILRKKISADDKDLSKEEQKEGLRVLGYYSTWEHLGTSLIKEMSREKAKLSKDGKLTLTEFVDLMNGINKEVSQMFDNVDKESKLKKKSK